MIMTNADLNSTYLKYRHMHNEKGNIDNLSPLMHYFLMDCAYQLYCQHVKNLPLRHKAAKERKRMREGFNSFFTKVHLAFNTEQKDYLLDKVDEFQHDIHNAIERCKIAVMNCFVGGEFQNRLLLSNIWLVNALAADAQGYMGCVYLTNKRHPQVDRDIDAVLTGSKELAKLMCACDESVNPKDKDNLDKAVSALAKDICKWVFNDYQKDKEYDTTD